MIAVQAAAGRGARGSAHAARSALRDPAAAAGRRATLAARPRPRLGRGGRRRGAGRLRAGRAPPTRCTSSTPRARPGGPKGVVRDNGGHAVALHWSMPNVYGVGPGDVFWAASDVGWVVGHSYIVYAPLLAGCTTVLYEGKPVGTPDAGAFWRVVAEHGVKALFTAPTAFRAIKKEDPDGAAAAARTTCRRCDTLFLAGERTRPRHATTGPRGSWPARSSTTGGRPRPAGRSRRTASASSRCRSSRARRPCRCPATTCASSPTTGPRPRPARRATSRSGCRCRPARCRRCGTTTSGSSSPTCPGTPATTSPATAATIDEDGYLCVMGRTDDVINVAGHRLSTGAMEEVARRPPGGRRVRRDRRARRAEGAGAARLRRAEGGRRPIEPDGSRGELVAAGPRAGRAGGRRSGRRASWPALPKTRSGKILRGTMRGIADGDEVPVPSTIEDPAVLDRIRPILRPQAR